MNVEPEVIRRMNDYKEPRFPAIEPYGERAVTVRWSRVMDEGLLSAIRALLFELEQHPLPGMIEAVGAYASVTIYFDPLRLYSFGRAHSRPNSPVNIMIGLIRERLERKRPQEDWSKGPIHRIPVCYGGRWGPDLEDVAEIHGMHPDDVIHMHSEPIYDVNMLGFAPGFPYLGGLPAGLETPRLQTPRTSVAAGSVGIADKQTGIYPLEIPGGWRIIGRTYTTLFSIQSEPPALLQPGDRIQFMPISETEFDRKRRDR